MRQDKRKCLNGIGPDTTRKRFRTEKRRSTARKKRTSLNFPGRTTCIRRLSHIAKSPSTYIVQRLSRSCQLVLKRDRIGPTYDIVGRPARPQESAMCILVVVGFYRVSDTCINGRASRNVHALGVSVIRIDSHSTEFILQQMKIGRWYESHSPMMMSLPNNNEGDLGIALPFTARSYMSSSVNMSS
jgi:hypothetical protein